MSRLVCLNVANPKIDARVFRNITTDNVFASPDQARGYTVMPAKPPAPELDWPLSLSIGEQ